MACKILCVFLFFFFNDTATTEIYTLSLHDALPILCSPGHKGHADLTSSPPSSPLSERSEEHTSELQSHLNLVCRLLLEKKKNNTQNCAYVRGHSHSAARTATPRRE